MEKAPISGLEILKKKILNDFSLFCQLFLDPDYYDEDFHTKLCQFIQYSKKDKLVVLPRTFLKTTIAASMYPLWRATKDPSIRVLITSNTTPNAQKTVRAIRNIVENHPHYQLLFPECIPDFGKVRWSDTCACLKRKEDYPEGTFEAAGVGSNIIRRHFNLIVEDDTVSPKKDELTGEEAMPSRDDIEKAVGFHKLTMPLLIDEDDMRIVIGTRWASYDLINYVRENEKFDIFDAPAVDEETGKPLFKRFSLERLETIRMSMGTYMFCNPSEAPILMANFTSKPIKDVIVGDEVVGFNLSIKGDKKKSHLISTKVVAKGSTVAPVYKVYMKSGRTIRCTKEHQWLANLRRGRDGHHPSYRTIESSLRYPLTLHYVCNPYIPSLSVEKQRIMDRLSGLYDGEGHCGAHITLAQSKKKHPEVFDLMVHSLEELGFKHNVHEKRSEPQNYTIVFGCKWEDRRRFLLQATPAKSKELIQSLYQAKFCKEVDDVDFIDVDKTEEVYWLQTESGNYICWGYASKNSSLYLNKPLAKEFMSFNPDWIRYYEEDELPKEGDGIVTIDPADPPTGKSSQDYSALVSCKHCKNGIYVRRYVRKRLTDKQLIEEGLRVAKLDGAYMIRVEADRYAHLQYGFREAMERSNTYYVIDPVKTKGKQKEGRIRQRLQPMFENGVMFLKRHMRELEEEMFSFPYGAHDDLIDALAWQIEKVWPTEKLAKATNKKKRTLPLFGEMLETLYHKKTDRQYPFESQKEGLLARPM